MTRGFYRGYVDGGKRSARVRRFHVMREDGPNPGRAGLCGIHGWDCEDSPARIIDPLPAEPPAGLTWCPFCVGLLAERLGRLDAIAAMLAEAERSAP